MSDPTENQAHESQADETVFGADFKILEPTGKGPAPKIKDRPEPKKKKQPSMPNKPPKGGKKASGPLPRGVLGYQPVVQSRPSTITHPFNW